MQLTFRVVQDEQGIDGEISANAADQGRTSTLSLRFEDEQGIGVTGEISAQVNYQEIPHTEDRKAMLDLSTLDVALDQAGDQSIAEQVLQSINVKQAFAQLQHQASD